VEAECGRGGITYSTLGADEGGRRPSFGMGVAPGGCTTTCPSPTEPAHEDSIFPGLLLSSRSDSFGSARRRSFKGVVDAAP
jgi:hypothetical protein